MNVRLSTMFYKIFGFFSLFVLSLLFSTATLYAAQSNTPVTNPSCNIHLECPGGAISVACNRHSCGGNCGECKMTCSKGCDSDSGGVSHSKGELGGDSNSDGGSNNPTPTRTIVSSDNNQPSPIGDPGGDSDPGDFCARNPASPLCGGNEIVDPPPPGGQNNISGRVWYDWDQNRKRNNGEPGVDDIQVEVRGGPENKKDRKKRTNNRGLYDFRNFEQGGYRVVIDPPNVWKVTTQSGKSQNVNIRNSNARDVDFGIYRGFDLDTRVYADLNGNGTPDTGEPGIAGIDAEARHIRMPARINREKVTNATGNLVFNNIPGGGSIYDIWVYDFSNGFQLQGDNPRQRRLNFDNNPTTEQIGLIPQWRISGLVFNDKDGDKKFDPDKGDTLLNSKPTISITGRSVGNSAIKLSTNSSDPFGNLRVNEDGAYSAQRLLPGVYDVTYIPQGVTTTPTTYRVTVGDGQKPFAAFNCTIPPQGNASFGLAYYCASINGVSGNAWNINFAITPTPPWYRTHGLDVRLPEIINYIPITACEGAYATIQSTPVVTSLSSTLTPGIMISGSSPLTLNFSPGSASVYNWKVQDTFTPPSGGKLQTSYNQIVSNVRKAGITPTLLRTASGGCPNENECQPSVNLPSGDALVYLHEGDLRITNWTVADNKQYLLLVNGDLTLGHDINGGTIRVGNTNAALAIIVSGNIRVDGSVGSRPFVCDDQTTIDGFFSSDHSFIVENSPCTTVGMVKMSGGIVVDAAQQAGRFINNRDLCDNTVYPSFSIRARPDMLLSMPELLKIQNIEYREVAP